MKKVADRPIRIVIVDDHPVVRAGLRMLIGGQKDMKIVAEAETNEQGLAAVGREQPDVILLDLYLGGVNMVDHLEEMREVSSRSRVLVLTGVHDPDLHRRALRLGAMGLVMKEEASEVIVRAIRKVNSGEAWIDRRLTASLLTEISEAAGKKEVDYETLKVNMLTKREREIIKVLCEGMNNQQIAARLFISEATVRNHITSILGKLELSDRFALAIYAYRHGLARPPS